MGEENIARMGEMKGEVEAKGQNSPEEESILVSVRVRPLNEKELARNDGSEWECISNNTIAIKNNLSERTLFPSAYTFDRVFGFDNPTKQVYEEGAKEVILSVVKGINSTIFAYGQTSSGKTYTMNGVTEYAIADIYNYIELHKEREFVSKFSAMEIYNEAVRDLLSADGTPLRLLDDPERGTVVEKLTEEVLRDRSHLQELLSICEAQRKIGETSLNETSSRSHQILRLTIESSAREFRLARSSSVLAASVNFVDLAGSERASQTLSAGARLKEGSHINRSLLTLGTVIRKLSKGRNGHIPYRDSKLTRILQNSLGGNARTAIICTLSPARSHIEQSKNTLFFASCAKEVTTNAKINVVVSDKALVKQLQRELAKMENELKTLASKPVSYDSADLLREKELLIEQMDREIKELRKERDLAESRIETMLQSVVEDQVSRSDENLRSEGSEITSRIRTDSLNVINSNNHQRRLSQISEDSFLQSAVEYRVSRSDEYLMSEGSESTSGIRNENLNLFNSNNHQRKISEASEDSMPQSVVEDQVSISDEYLRSEVLELRNGIRPDNLTVFNSNNHQRQLSETSEESISLRFYEQEPSQGWEEIAQESKAKTEDNICKEVRCIEMGESRMDQNAVLPVVLPIPEERARNSAMNEEKELSEKAGKSAVNEVKELSPIVRDCSYDALKRKIREMQRTIDSLVNFSPSEKSPCSSETCMSSSRSLILTRSRSCKAVLTSSPSSVQLNETEQNEKDFPRAVQSYWWNSSTSNFGKLSRKDSHSSTISSSYEAEDTKDSDVEETFEKESPGRANGVEQNFSRSNNGHHTIKLLRNDSRAFVLSSPLGGTQRTKEIRLEHGYGDFYGREKNLRQKLFKSKYGAKAARFCRRQSLASVLSAPVERYDSKESDSDDTLSVLNFVPEQNKPQYENQYSDNLEEDEVEEMGNLRGNVQRGGVDAPQDRLQPNLSWTFEFERQRQEIIELWDLCYVPLAHRSYFFLLYKGEPSDSVYFEVELRRLSFLKDTFSIGSNVKKDSQILTPASSLKMLNREREMLSKKVHKKFSRKEREKLYQKWGIKLNSKQRSLTLARWLWTNTKDIDHSRESAQLVAKLVGFMEPSQVPKEIFGLSFLPQLINRKNFEWKHTMSSKT